MKFVIERKRLLLAAKKVTKATGVAVDKSNSAIEGILLDADSDKQTLKLSATDFTVSMQIKLRNAEVTESGSAIIPAKLFIGMLNTLDGEKAAVTLHDNVMMLQSGNPIFTFNTAEAKEFPTIAVPIAEEMVRVKGISAITAKAQFTAEMNTNNPEHEGVYLRLSDNISSAAATNGRTYVKACDDGMADGELEVFIPNRAIRILSATLNPDDEIFAGVKNNCVTFLGRDFIFCSRILSTDLKKVESIVEKVNPKYGALVDAEELASALDICLGINLDNDKCVDFLFTGSGIKLSDVNQHGNFNMVIIDYKRGNGGNGEIATESPSKIFHYNPLLIYKFVKNCKGMVGVSADESGVMKLTNSQNGAAQTTYIVCPRNARKVKDKDAEAKTKTKTSKKAKEGKAA